MTDDLHCCARCEDRAIADNRLPWYARKMVVCRPDQTRTATTASSTAVEESIPVTLRVLDCHVNVGLPCIVCIPSHCW